MGIKRLAGMLVVTMATAGLATGCDKLLKGEETEEEEPEKDTEEKKEEEPTAAASASATASSDAEDFGEVETYPEMTKAGGTFRLLRPFQVYQAADLGSKKLTGLARNTLVDFKFFYKDWIMIDWPSGPGELSPGWINLRPQDRARDAKVEEKEEEEEVPDAGIEAADAAATADAAPTETADAAPPPPPPPETDAGRGRRLRFKIPRPTR